MVSTKLVALWPSWVTENHFSPFQINTQLLFIFEFFTQLFFLHKMAVGGHFGLPKITFGCISLHFRSIRNFLFEFFFTKWLPAAILEVRFGPFWMTENHFRSHFSPFQIIHNFFCFEFFFKWLPKYPRIIP